MLDGLQVDPGWAAAIGAALLRRGDPLGLALAAQVGLELGEDAEHDGEDRRDGGAPERRMDANDGRGPRTGSVSRSTRDGRAAESA